MSGFSHSPSPTFHLIDAREEWDEDVPIPLGHALVPEAIRVGVLALWQPGDSLHRVPTRDTIEWWLLDAEGQLIEAFCLED